MGVRRDLPVYWRLGRLLLALLAAILAATFVATSVSAASTVGAETCVRASSVVVEVPVGPPEAVSAGQRLGSDGPRGVTVVATGVAANAGEDSVSLFRAVSKAEADDIAGHGFRQAPSGRSYEGKLFATTADDAARYGRINYGQDALPFHIVETRVPRSFADQLYTGTADRMIFRAVDPGQLADLNRLGSTSTWNYVPWVAKP